MSYQYEGELVDWLNDRSLGYHRYPCRDLREAMQRALADINNPNARPHEIRENDRPIIFFMKWPGTNLRVGFFGPDKYLDEQLWKELYPYPYD